jgi:hypothetical protein
MLLHPPANLVVIGRCSSFRSHGKRVPRCSRINPRARHPNRALIEITREAAAFGGVPHVSSIPDTALMA